MEKLNFKGNVPVNGGHIEAGLSLLTFQEDNVYIVYSAELDLSGSGNDFNQAKASFWETLSEFMRYGVAKGTLWTDLERLGWKIKGGKKGKKLKSPQIIDMLKTNKEFADILENKDYTSYKEKVQIPQFA